MQLGESVGRNTKPISLALWKDHARKFIIESYIKQSFRSVSFLIRTISTDEDPSLRIESFAIIMLRSVFTKLLYSSGKRTITNLKSFDYSCDLC